MNTVFYQMSESFSKVLTCVSIIVRTDFSTSYCKKYDFGSTNIIGTHPHGFARLRELLCHQNVTGNDNNSISLLELS